MEYKPGQLIRWIENYDTYTASEDGIVRGLEPNYRHAIITATALDNSTVIAYCYDCKILDWIVLDPLYDQFQIISEED